MERIALSLPKLELLRAEVRALGADTWRVRFAVANSGWLPAYVTQASARAQGRARRHVRDRPARRAPQLIGGTPRVEGAQLEGHAPKASLQAFLPNREVTADRALAEWVVQAPRGTRARA